MKSELKRKVKDFSGLALRQAKSVNMPELTNAKTAETKTQQPEIEVYITDEWRVSDLRTLDDCTKARDHLTGIIAAIEHRIASTKLDYSDYAKARTALRWKKRALQLVQEKHGVLAREARRSIQDSRDRQLLALIKALYPNEFAKAAAVFKESEKELNYE